MKSKNSELSVLAATAALFLSVHEEEIFKSESTSTCFNSQRVGDGQFLKIEKCVPNYSLIKGNVEHQVGRISLKQTELLLVAAFNYENYSVVTTEAEGWYGKRLYCRYLGRSFKEVVPPTETLVFPEFVVYCCAHVNVSYLSVTETMYESLNKWVPVRHRENGDYRYTIAFCLAPIYGNESIWLLLAEMVEHYKLQGVEHFYVYVKELDDYSQKLLDDYANSGDAEVVYLRLQDKRNNKAFQIAGIQDCLYRNKKVSRYLLFGDLDERIISLENATLSHYIVRKFNEHARCAVLSFDPRWILRTSPLPTLYQGESTLQKHLPTMVFHNTSAKPVTGDTAKYVLDTDKVILALVHEVPLIFANFNTCYIPPSSAYIRHYRSMTGHRFLTLRLAIINRYGRFSMTYYPHSLQAILFSNVKKRLDRVFLEITGFKSAISKDELTARDYSEVC